MEFSEIVRLNIKHSESYNSMVVCDIVSRIQETKSENNCNTKNKQRHTNNYEKKVKM